MLHLWNGEEVAMAERQAARVPTLTVPPGPQRLLHIRAETAGETITATVRDGEQKTTYHLERPQGAADGEAQPQEAGRSDDRGLPPLPKAIARRVLKTLLSDSAKRRLGGWQIDIADQEEGTIHMHAQSVKENLT